MNNGMLSVVLVNFRGTDDTLLAVDHLRALDWPVEDLEIVVVENASGDDSAARLRDVDGITLVESSENLGFAGGCNLGVSRSVGQFVAFLNNDARPDRDWARAAVSRLRSAADIGAVATKVLDWEGERVDFVDAGLTWYGMGYKPLTAETFTRDTVPAGGSVLFGTGSSMFVRRDVFEQLGGFDERFFMFFEDVDFGWRVNLAGWRFAYEPASIAYHRHHASMTSFGQWKEDYLLERNALFALYKNASDATLARVLPAALALAVRRGMAKGGVDSEAFDIRRADADRETVSSLPKQALAPLFGIDQFVSALPELAEDRRRIQAERVLPEHAVEKLFRETNVPAVMDPYYLDGYANIVDAFGVLDKERTTRVLVITGDPIGVQLAGPGIRAWNMAEVLSRISEVRLVSTNRMDKRSAAFETDLVSIGDHRGMRRHEDWADVIVFQGLAMAQFPAVRDSQKLIVADVYDPMHLEQLEQARGQSAEGWSTAVDSATGVLNEQLARADFLLCASERQRHFYLGQLAALGRVNTANYASDPDLSGLLAVVPFGLSSIPPVHERAALRGADPRFSEDAKILIWAGGLYNWFDPRTLIEATAVLSRRRSDVRLFFIGTKNPNPGVPEMEIVTESRRLAMALGVLDTAVVFNDSWVDFADRQNYLLEADAGVSTHHAHIETTFSFRTRILDYLWAGLPMVVTDGDSFADLVRAERLGIVVPAGDVDALVDALETILYDEDFRREAITNIRRVAEQFRWERVLQPLVDFVQAAVPAPDRAFGASRSRSVGAVVRRPVRMYGWKHDISRVQHYLRNGGPTVVVAKVVTRLRGLRK